MMKRFKWSYVPVGLLVIVYIASAVRFFSISSEVSNQRAENTDSRVIRVAHWQLEPGFREGLQQVMDDYNALPHIEKAGIRVEQMAIPERVYSQFLNVHLISGTAPDIAVNGKSVLISGNGIAKFFSPISGWINEPNPYNAKAYTSPELSDELRETLANSGWKDTFLDGMYGGYNAELNNYYGVPISLLGGNRIFYNMKLIAEAKAFAAEALDAPESNPWLKEVLLDGRKGFLPDSPELRTWLAGDEVPQTLGQLFLVCHAFRELSSKLEGSNRVAISASNYPFSDLTTSYETIFTHKLAREIAPYFPASDLSPLMAIEAKRKGLWDYDHPALKSYYDFAQKISEFFPIGYLGQDREQAQRRFVLGNALLLASGGWDAAGIYSGVASRDLAADKFEISIAPLPLPASNERWGDFANTPRSEASARGAVPFAINNDSPFFDESLDFLMYLTSHPVNEKFNKLSGWVPVTIGTQPVERMVPFTPVTEGFPPYAAIDVARPVGADPSIASIRSPYNGLRKQFLANEITYAEFVQRVEKIFYDPRLGIDRYWLTAKQRQQDRSRSVDRSMSIDDYKVTFGGDERSGEAYIRKFYNSAVHDQGHRVRTTWFQFNGDAPFPEVGGK